MEVYSLKRLTITESEIPLMFTLTDFLQYVEYVRRFRYVPEEVGGATAPEEEAVGGAAAIEEEEERVNYNYLTLLPYTLGHFTNARNSKIVGQS